MKQVGQSQTAPLKLRIPVILTMTGSLQTLLCMVKTNFKQSTRKFLPAGVHVANVVLCEYR